MKKIWIFLVLMGMIFITSCSKIKNVEINEVVNHVTNEITTKTVDVKDYSIEDVEDAIITCIEKVEDAVIGISLKREVVHEVNGTNYVYYDTESLGSAVIYKRIENKDDGGNVTSYTYYAYTNEHVVTSEQTAYNHKAFAYIKQNDVEVEVEVLGKDKKLDVAVIKFDTYLLIEPVKLADSDSVKKGSIVVAIGNPEGFAYYGSSTKGIISNVHVKKSVDTDSDGVNDFVCEYVQTDAAINPGNSGGGLFLLDGTLVGIPSLKLVSNNIDNMGFAIPSNMVRIAAEEYLEKGLEIIRPHLGVICTAIRNCPSSFMISNEIYQWPNIYDGDEPYGVYISKVTGLGSLVGSGIEEKDIILKIDGEKVIESNDISAKLNSLDIYEIGDKVTLTYYSHTDRVIKDVEVILKQE